MRTKLVKNTPGLSIPRFEKIILVWILDKLHWLELSFLEMYSNVTYLTFESWSSSWPRAIANEIKSKQRACAVKNVEVYNFN